jgi:hypothetical protein
VAELTKAEFLALVDTYLGAREHERWAKEHGTQDEHRRAIEASREARAALERLYP